MGDQWGDFWGIEKKRLTRTAQAVMCEKRLGMLFVVVLFNRTAYPSFLSVITRSTKCDVVISCAYHRRTLFPKIWNLNISQ